MSSKYTLQVNAIHRSLQQELGADPVVAQSDNEGHRLPMVMW